MSKQEVFTKTSETTHRQIHNDFTLEKAPRTVQMKHVVQEHKNITKLHFDLDHCLMLLNDDSEHC